MGEGAKVRYDGPRVQVRRSKSEGLVPLLHCRTGPSHCRTGPSHCRTGPSHPRPVAPSDRLSSRYPC